MKKYILTLDIFIIYSFISFFFANNSIAEQTSGLRIVQSLSMLKQKTNLKQYDVDDITIKILDNRSIDEYLNSEGVDRNLLQDYITSVVQFKSYLGVSQKDALKVLSAIINRVYSDDGTVKPEEHSNNSDVDLNLSEEEAVKIIEIILVKIYGDQVLNQRPWIIRESDGIYVIKGSMPAGSLQDSGIQRGGTAEIHINKSNAQILKVRHGR